LPRIQTKRYRKKYLSKAVYSCRSYFIYVAKSVAERFKGKELKLVVEENAIVFRVIGEASATGRNTEAQSSNQSP